MNWLMYQQGCVIQGPHDTFPTPADDMPYSINVHIHISHCHNGGTSLLCKAILFFWLFECFYMKSITVYDKNNKTDLALSTL